MIRLIDGYVIDVDSHCYILGIAKKEVVVDKKTGESKEVETLTNQKYYSTLDGVLTCWWRIMRKKELSKFEGSINEALELVKKLDAKVLNTISAIKATVQD